MKRQKPHANSRCSIREVKGYGYWKEAPELYLFRRRNRALGLIVEAEPLVDKEKAPAIWAGIRRKRTPYFFLGVERAENVSPTLQQMREPDVVPTMKRQLYASSNGDRWYLVRDGDTGGVFVQHIPNAASGGRASEIEIGVFLTRGGGGSPEQQALLNLIGSLVDDGGAAGPVDPAGGEGRPRAPASSAQ
jgi:hypothetical protein